MNCSRSFSSIAAASPCQLKSCARCSSCCSEMRDPGSADATCCFRTDRRFPMSTWPFDNFRRISYLSWWTKFGLHAGNDNHKGSGRSKASYLTHATQTGEVTYIASISSASRPGWALKSNTRIRDACPIRTKYALLSTAGCNAWMTSLHTYC